jgi:hypothetical protein
LHIRKKAFNSSAVNTLAVNAMLRSARGTDLCAVKLPQVLRAGGQESCGCSVPLTEGRGYEGYLCVVFSSVLFSPREELQPYFPASFPGLPFALAPQCSLNGVGSDGEWHGVCRYYGGNPIDGVRGWMHGIDAAGNTGLEVDGTGTNIPVLLTP